MSKPYYRDDHVKLLHGDALHIGQTLPTESVDCIVTSPPYYGLRDYGKIGQYGLEETPDEYVATMRTLFSEMRRVLASDGTLWLNIGDGYSSAKSGQVSTAVDGGTLTTVKRRPVSGLPPKNLLGIPWRVAFALQADGWILRNAIVWNKTNAMPESVTSRFRCRHEMIFMFAKSQRHHFDLDAVRMPSTRSKNPIGTNPGDVWDIATQPFKAAHFAVFPQEIARRAIRAGCKPGGTVLDPFSGSGTTGMVARNEGRRYIGIDISSEYLDLSLETRFNLGGAA